MSSKSLPINRKAVHCTGVHGAGGGWGRNLTAESGAVRCEPRRNWSEKFAYFVIRGQHQPRAWLSGYLVLHLSWTLSRSPDTGDMETAWLETWLELSHQHNPHIQGVEYV